MEAETQTCMQARVRMSNNGGNLVTPARDSADDDVDAEVWTDDARQNRYPYSVVWGTLPLISWFLPFIGHMGICDAQGRVHDFAGPYFIGVDRFMTGDVLKTYKFSREELQRLPRVASGEGTAREVWDSAVAAADSDYSKQMHNICCNNCHHHTAQALRYMGLQQFTMLSVWWLLQSKGRYVTWGRLLQTYFPFLFICTIIILITVFK